MDPEDLAADLSNAEDILQAEMSGDCQKYVDGQGCKCRDHRSKYYLSDDKLD